MTYLDHAATTPMRPAAVEAWSRAAAVLGNPSSLHSYGRTARRVVEEARESIATGLRVDPHEVVLTAGGTEADNLGVKGLFWARTAVDPERRVVLVPPVEHAAVVESVEWLAARAGAEVRWLPVGPTGRVDLVAAEALVARHAARLALLTCMWANNEVGTVQPVAELVALAHGVGAPVHVDAVQAVGWLDVDLARVPVDSLALSGHKLGGPVGAGALVLRRGTAAEPVLHGGGQERGVRSGTVDAPAAAGLAAALRATLDDRAAGLPERVAALRDDLAGHLLGRRDVMLCGPGLDRPGARLPNNLHVVVAGCEGDVLLYCFDAAGIAVSTGSACSAGVAGISHVLTAMGVPAEFARGGLRLSLGHTSTAADVAAVAEALPGVLRKARAAAAALSGSAAAGGPSVAPDRAARPASVPSPPDPARPGPEPARLSSDPGRPGSEAGSEAGPPRESDPGSGRAADPDAELDSDPDPRPGPATSSDTPTTFEPTTFEPAPIPQQAGDPWQQWEESRERGPRRAGRASRASAAQRARRAGRAGRLSR